MEIDSQLHDREELGLIHPLNLDQAEEQIQKWAFDHPMKGTVTHRFTPGLYIREILMPTGSILTSKIHKTEHPYVISKGKVSVWTEKEGSVKLEAPHTGITKPGTRRLLYVNEDTIWTTFHPTNETDVSKIEEQIIESHHNPLLLTEQQMKELMS